MDRQEWKVFAPYFTPEENWGEPDKIEYNLVQKLYAMRLRIKEPIIIHCGTQGKHVPGSYHNDGMAVDCHCSRISLLGFYIEAERQGFGGIGCYQFWNNPGLHLDIRPLRTPFARWCRDSKGEYQKLSEVAFI